MLNDNLCIKAFLSKCTEYLLCRELLNINLWTKSKLVVTHSDLFHLLLDTFSIRVKSRKGKSPKFQYFKQMVSKPFCFRLAK